MNETLAQAKDIVSLIRQNIPIRCAAGSADQYLLALDDENRMLWSKLTTSDDELRKAEKELKETWLDPDGRDPNAFRRPTAEAYGRLCIAYRRLEVEKKDWMDRAYDVAALYAEESRKMSRALNVIKAVKDLRGWRDWIAKVTTLIDFSHRNMLDLFSELKKYEEGV